MVRKRAEKYIFYHICLAHNVMTSKSNQFIYTVSQKNCAKLFLSELRQIFTNFDNFWQKDGTKAEIMRDALNLHLI